jgi:hypothetical protein
MYLHKYLQDEFNSGGVGLVVILDWWDVAVTIGGPTT